jgi:hypothetical protein
MGESRMGESRMGRIGRIGRMAVSYVTFPIARTSYRSELAARLCGQRTLGDVDDPGDFG